MITEPSDCSLTIHEVTLNSRIFISGILKKFFLCLVLFILVTPLVAAPFNNMDQHRIAQALAWVKNENTYCGGYFQDQPISAPAEKGAIEILSHPTIFSQHGTSILNNLQLTREGQQIRADKAYLYRKEDTGKFDYLELQNNVHLRDAKSFIIASSGTYQFDTQAKFLKEVLYRTNLSLKNNPTSAPTIQKGLIGWGSAQTFKENQPLIYDFKEGSFSTCPPINPAWQIKTKHLKLDKNIGRGYATQARLYIKNTPVLYIPYINFPLDSRRKTGFLWPTYGAASKTGPAVYTPFYWNMAPNYDNTTTLGLLAKRGVELVNSFRYLSEVNKGTLDFTFLPKDREFEKFKKDQLEKYGQTTQQPLAAELTRLQNSSITRKALSWRNDARYNEHWSSHIDFNYAGDDYLLKDLGASPGDLTINQLLQEAEVNYQSQYWYMTTRLQTYQTLHPLDEPLVENQYRKLPQIVLNGYYPGAYGLDYFIENELTHFELLKTPGLQLQKPIANRFHMQPGISWPYFSSALYVNPRIQFALTKYLLYQNQPTGIPGDVTRAIPIFDIVSRANLMRDVNLFKIKYQQTLEPQIYYTYIPYRKQSAIPIFDTTVNTLTYDQIFNYNRFSGLDRIGDANQVGIGVSTRFIDDETGFEKMRLGLGELFYFSRRKVTLCNDKSCNDNPESHQNQQRLSPLSGILEYHVNPHWSLAVNTIWNPISKQVDNNTLGLHYKPDETHILNADFSFARKGDVYSGIPIRGAENNLKITDFSFAWPLPIIKEMSIVGRWSQNWSQQHLQNLLYGLQYDTCCWAVQFVGGHAYTGINPNDNNKPEYNSQYYLQFSLKGLGNIGTGNPTHLLKSIGSYTSQFGRGTS